MFNNLFLFISVLFFVNCGNDTKSQNSIGILFKDSLNTLSIYIPKSFSLIDSKYEKEILGDKYELFSASFRGEEIKITDFIKEYNYIGLSVNFNSYMKDLAKVDSLEELASSFDKEIINSIKSNYQSEKKNYFLIKQKFYNSLGTRNIQLIETYCVDKSDLFFLKATFYYTNEAQPEKNYKEIIVVLESLEFTH